MTTQIGDASSKMARTLAQQGRGDTPKTRVQLFDAALVGLTDERGSVYGHPLDDFANVEAASAVLAQCADPEVRHALRMIWLKVCRLVATPDHADSLHDIAGYARCIAMIHDERAPP